MKLYYSWADEQLRGRVKREILCPQCSDTRKPEHRKKPCLGLTHLGGGRITYNCMNCGIHGVLSEGWTDGPQPPPRYRPATVLIQRPSDESSGWASKVSLGTIPAVGTVMEQYWSERFNDAGVPIPASCRYHPRLRYDDGKFYPAMVTAYGFPPYDKVTAVHRTFLTPDGKGCVGRMALGAHKGLPMVVHENPESRGLVIAEGVEKAVAAGYALGVDAWASGGVSFMPALAPTIPADTECVTIVVDPGPEPMRYCKELAAALRERDIEYRAIRL